MVSREEVINKAKELQVDLDESQVELFILLNKLPSLDFESQVYKYKNIELKPRKINLSNRSTFLITYFKLIGKLPEYQKEYGETSGFILFILEGQNGKRIIDALLDGDKSKINFEPETEQELYEYQLLLSEIIVDFFLLSRKILKK